MRRIKGITLFIGDFFSHSVNYCHWTLDNMPRILAAREAGLAFNNVLGAFSPTHAFQTYSLSRLLEDGETYMAVASDEGLFEIDTLYYADNYAIEHLDHPACGCDPILLDSLRHKLGVTRTTSERKRLYASRRHNRRVINEAELVGLLGQHGFQTVDTDALSIEAQIDLFSSAEAVVAPHGAALTNLLYAPPGTSVLEFFPAFGGSAGFYRLAPALGMNYACWIDDISYGPNRDQPGLPLSNHADILVDLDFVSSWLEHHMKS